MSKDDVYSQVELKDGAKSYVVWVPKEFGVFGKKLKIDSSPGDWEVIAVYATKDREFLDQLRGGWTCFNDVLEGH